MWIYDLSGASAPRRLTFGGKNRFPIWSADGERVAFQSDREGDLGIFWQRADGTDAGGASDEAGSGNVSRSRVVVAGREDFLVQGRQGFQRRAVDVLHEGQEGRDLRRRGVFCAHHLDLFARRSMGGVCGLHGTTDFAATSAGNEFLCNRFQRPAPNIRSHSGRAFNRSGLRTGGNSSTRPGPPPNWTQSE